MNHWYAILIFLSTFCLGLSSHEAKAQVTSAVLDDVVESIIDGDSDRLTQHLNDRIEITLLSQRQTYAVPQARFVISKFFNEYPPLYFEIKHKGAVNNTTYALGEYRSTNGVYFDVNIFLRLNGKLYKVDEIRFERR